ncbi:MAG: type II toxin-antitoxin system MqsA family antitoxin [Synergistaceae bacterium]|nr:type II toxin-antitoxin system MqsA family antitoxin [Synergistaceae bacterium]MBQ6737731.1 type II toxin-antitoxin system MqsA family antitoxin [Synergistaceae bacterium]MBQ7067782.1 type II toxin-antitoxin system MqsA family antitoxin [Synergistaceae bacterium]MBR0076339.1 type II toxin-antitoxin system MqsA family antitoxin [Synergistaceae bacterium]MBR0080038.1 type II toxin-antitoxin system MqsA family antitoxin [Synergistaceae bacterium]
MRCTVCKNDEVKDSITTYFVSLKECYVIIENVPCKKCSQCGEEFFSVHVMERIDEIIDSIRNIAGKIFVLEYKSVA